MIAATLLNKRYALTAMHCVQDNGIVASSAVVGSTFPIDKVIMSQDFLTEGF
jgi:secreted trypsin-like serine protease